MRLFDLDVFRRSIVEQLPRRARWLARGTASDWDFSRAEVPLRSALDLWEPLLEGESAPWADLYVFGDEDLAELDAHPLIAVNVRTRVIFALHADRDEDQLFFLNSGPEEFIQSFRLLDAALNARSVPLEELAQRLAAIDPDGYPGSYWRDLAEYVTAPAAGAERSADDESGVEAAAWELWNATSTTRSLAEECEAYLELGPPREMEDYLPESLSELIISHGAQRSRLDPQLAEVGTMIACEPGEFDERTRRVRAYLRKGKALVRAVVEANRAT